MQFDLVLKGGHLIDPQNGIDAPRDIGIEGKVIAAIDAELPTEGAGQVIDVSGLYVTPGAGRYPHPRLCHGWSPRYVGRRQQHPARRL